MNGKSITVLKAHGPAYLWQALEAGLVAEDIQDEAARTRPKTNDWSTRTRCCAALRPAVRHKRLNVAAL